LTAAIFGKFERGGGARDARERLVDHEHVGDVLCAVRSQAIAAEAKHKSNEHETVSGYDSCQTGQVYGGGAYSSETRLLLTTRASPIAFAPSAPMLFRHKLPRKQHKMQDHLGKEVGSRCQWLVVWLLTVAKRGRMMV